VSPELEQIRREAERLTAEMSQADWHHTAPGKWSCAQTFEHLLLSYMATTKGTLRAMEIGRPLGGRPTLRDRISTFYVAGLGFQLSERIAPQQTPPTDGASLESLRQFNDALVAMDATLADAEKRFGTRVKLLDHPILGPLTANEWRRFHRTHARHHLKEIAERIRSASAASQRAGTS
jgi:DinB superfamily